jgi:hypothetical protein
VHPAGIEWGGRREQPTRAESSFAEALARAINSEPATVRRLFSAGHVNPTLGTLAEVAAALGMRVVLEPLEDGDRKRITGPILAGSTDDPQVLARRLDAMRRKPESVTALSGG